MPENVCTNLLLLLLVLVLVLVSAFVHDVMRMEAAASIYSVVDVGMVFIISSGTVTL